MKSIDRILIVGFALTFVDLITGRQDREELYRMRDKREVYPDHP